MRTHTVTLGTETIALRVPLTARQRETALGEWWSASATYAEMLDRLRAVFDSGESVPVDLQTPAMTRAELDVQAGLGAALARLAPDDHRWREVMRRYAAEGHPSPALAAGLDIVDELAEQNVMPSDVAEALIAVTSAATPAPTQRQVEAAEGNSLATPS